MSLKFHAYIAEICNMCLKCLIGGPCIYKNVWERSTAKNYHPVCLLPVVRVFKKHVNNMIFDHLEKCGLFSDLFSDFQYGFRSSPSTADLLTVLSDRIVRAFNRSRAT